MVGVLVVAVRGVDGDAARLFVRVPLLGLGEVGVDLEGERGAGGEDLEEEREAGAEAFDGRAAELALGVGGDHVAERDGAAAAVDAGGRAGVCAHPHLGLRLAGGGGAEQFRDGGGGAPGVGAHGVGEAVHAERFLTVLSVRTRTGGVPRPGHGRGMEASAR